MRSDCLTFVDSATATSKPRPVATMAPEPARPIFRISRRVTSVTSHPATNRFGLQLDASQPEADCQVRREAGVASAGGHLQVAAVIVSILVAQEVDQARIPGHDEPGRAARGVGREGLLPGHSVRGHLYLDPRIGGL